jgi:hypothetical protein
LIVGIQFSILAARLARCKAANEKDRVFAAVFPVKGNGGIFGQDEDARENVGQTYPQPPWCAY